MLEDGWREEGGSMRLRGESLRGSARLVVDARAAEDARERAEKSGGVVCFHRF